MADVCLGMDIGGTNTVFGLVLQEGRVVYRNSLPTASFATVSDLLKAVKADLAKSAAEYRVIGIGIGAPNANYYTGMIVDPPNLPWPTTHVTKQAHEIFGVQTLITNDANAAAVGEKIFGAAADLSDFVMITLGTGLGSGIFTGGQLLYGHDGFAGEVGHITAVENGRSCGCGKKGCLETYASATGIKRTAHELMADSNRPSVLRQYSDSSLSSKAIYEAAVAGDALAEECFETTGAYLAKTLADVTAVLSPKAYILFGGLANAGDLILEPVKRHFEDHVFHAFRGKTEFRLSRLPEADAPILGSAALAWDKQ